MPVIHALHSVLVGLFVVTNLLLIPIAAMFGAALGGILLLKWSPDALAGCVHQWQPAFLTLSEIQKNNRILAS